MPYHCRHLDGNLGVEPADVLKVLFCYQIGCDVVDRAHRRRYGPPSKSGTSATLDGPLRWPASPRDRYRRS
jgi:hypothetical protein